MVVLTAGSMVTLGPGIALADGYGHGPGRGQAKGATATGGSALVEDAFQQNTAQEARQNNNCADLNPTPGGVNLTGGRADARCATDDESFNHKAWVQGGGAEANGGSSSEGTLVQQNTAQQGRQNNNCANPNAVFFGVTGGRLEVQCADKDKSVNKHTWYKGGGAAANGGSGAATAFQQNTAQEGRQNNNCANGNNEVVDLDGGRLDARCRNKDGSINKDSGFKGGGAEANGGSSESALVQQNLAQEGRQNINCATPNTTEVSLSGHRAEAHCGNKDDSFNRKAVVKGGGAEANGGSAPTEVFQQNVAQEGRQNINCANPNGFEVEATGSRDRAHCWHKDKSFNHKTFVKGGGAEANGGSGALDDFGQQNVAQEGRQNSNCANPNGGEVELAGSRRDVKCGAVDKSTNVRTKEIGGGAEADGGSGELGLFQQNVAQEGRQNNNCGNPNNLDVVASGSRTSAQCLAVDESISIDSVYR
ncbi:hypothetical protein [Streptomyces sp. NPDC048639]|uniref:hypothetical protein n=1 Tax=Streptomyces sp. NPDC048639 TaxID=3365581 RepID=UPI00371B84E6